MDLPPPFLPTRASPDGGLAVLTGGAPYQRAAGAYKIAAPGRGLSYKKQSRGRRLLISAGNGDWIALRPPPAGIQPPAAPLEIPPPKGRRMPVRQIRTSTVIILSVSGPVVKTLRPNFLPNPKKIRQKVPPPLSFGPKKEDAGRHPLQSAPFPRPGRSTAPWSTKGSAGQRPPPSPRSRESPGCCRGGWRFPPWQNGPADGRSCSY